MANGHGGARPGAGRKKGSPRRAKKFYEEHKRLMGPVDYLLEVMRDEDNKQNVRIDAAKAVAPYIAPRLMAAQIQTTDTDRALILQTLLERAQDDSSGHTIEATATKAITEDV